MNRSAFDRIIENVYISVNTGSAQDANATRINKKDADEEWMPPLVLVCACCSM